MVKFRRSMKSDKSDSKPHHISIPPKDAIAIIPPKKVIKALYDYTASDPDPASGYLSFSQGDFLHVVARENDPDWYEACNPLVGTRGLVPVKYFELVGKTVRDSGGSTSELANLPSAGHDSGYAEKTTPEHDPMPIRMSKSMTKGSGAMVYGIVMYDFKAERPDELEAKEGEAIIVIAQSNPEWFVAKPITRLGGPGLIPVSFIEIRDMTTGQAVPDAQAAVQRAGVPRVEEWKKMAAEYKNGSIPLGKLEANSAQSLQQGMERMSVRSQNGHDPNGYSSYERSGSVPHNAYLESQGPRPLAPVSASVPRYCYADDIFWFIVECEMEDGRFWELSRLYQDFYDLQIRLIQEFPLEAGQRGVERTLPYMPGPVTYVTDNISNLRRSNLDDYIKNLLKLGPHIAGSDLVRGFFEPKKNDYEIDPNVNEDEYRLSGASQQSDPSQDVSRQSSSGNLQQSHSHTQSLGQASYASVQSHQRGKSSVSSHAQSLRPSQPAPMLRNNSALTQTSASSANTGTGTGLGAHKIKVWFEEDNCVVIRMPALFRYADLYKKLKERRALERGEEIDAGGDEELVIEWRDENTGEYYGIRGDDDLAEAVARCPKLVLWVGVN
ncbi:scaffold protein Scd2 [Saccharata proteae CBS 121410]|uniref:Scaffold protein Scd2 n=1 Tax=Saccharata proteae CBS 121410 TaxID=1314787 RepID=A0A9P4I1A6_9PEZI|nr:scaffold protein Scd2 [Saccharata proteae CBS 121410]